MLPGLLIVAQTLTKHVHFYRRFSPLIGIATFWKNRSLFGYNAAVIPSSNFRDNLNDTDKFCIYNILEAQSRQIPEAVAIAAPGRLPLTYAGLRNQVQEVKKVLMQWDWARMIV